MCVQVSRMDLDGRKIDFRLVHEGEAPGRAQRDKAGVTPTSGQFTQCEQEGPQRLRQDEKLGSGTLVPVRLER
jgi:ribonuclease R